MYVRALPLAFLALVAGQGTIVIVISCLLPVYSVTDSHVVRHSVAGNELHVRSTIKGLLARQTGLPNVDQIPEQVRRAYVFDG